jgi:ABC-type Zn uptake system ZnuABC Zn-binding protein ZnuA
MGDSMQSNIKQLDEDKISKIETSVQGVQTLVAELIQNKKQAIFSDKYMSQKIFQEIRASSKHH